MADTAVAKRPSTLQFTDPTYSSALDIDNFENEDNDYAKLKKLQRHLEWAPSLVSLGWEGMNSVDIEPYAGT
jgi:hypothetical protein